MTRGELSRCNLDYLYELARGDKAFIREMVSIFIDEIGAELHKLSQQILSSDFSGIKHLSHKLRSSIPYVGLDSLIGEELAEMEDFARDHSQLSKIQRHFKKVRSVCEDAAQELMSLEI